MIKTLSVNWICHVIYKCKLKLCYPKMKPYVNKIQKMTVFSEPKLIKNALKRRVEVFRQIYIWNSSLKNMDSTSSRLKRRKIVLLFRSSHFLLASLTVQGCFSGYGIGSSQCIRISEQHILPSRRCLFQGRPCIFQQHNTKPHIAAILTDWLNDRKFRCWKGLPEFWVI